ncbi:LytR/AlgR family response regulator transcription factor [Mucilaginibacter calamicampi]|uniref:LytR/AlgR family response regulator transcription factor n=1 Tax=Mucilaginibacter calamicampi TaxID=1302352 RepID=A0ABW2Z0A7_9SPHI
MIKAIAIDDEPVALSIIEMHAQRVPFITLEAIFTSARAALDQLAKESVDLIFLDINMPNMGGLEFAALVDPAIQIVFTTAHSQHAVKGYDIDIADFLLKPITYPRFLQACERVQKNIGKNDIKQPASNNESLFVKDGYNWVRVFIADLLYVKTEDNYINMVEAKRQTLVRMTMQEFLNKAPVCSFIRVHKSYAVNVAYVERLQSSTIVIGDAVIPISKSFAADVTKYLIKPPQ